SFLSIIEARGTERRSEPDTHAGFGGCGAALVGHHRALEGAEHGYASVDRDVEAGTSHRSDRAVLARRREPEGLPGQHAVDVRVTEPLQRDHAAMHAGPDRVVTEVRGLRELELAALLDVLQRAAADREILRRALLAVAVEDAGEIAHARERRERVAVAERVAHPIGELGTDEPAAVARGRVLQTITIERQVAHHRACRLVVGAAALHREVQEMRGPVKAAIDAAGNIVGVDALRIPAGREPAGAAADEGAKQEIAAHLAVHAEEAAPDG